MHNLHVCLWLVATGRHFSNLCSACFPLCPSVRLTGSCFWCLIYLTAVLRTHQLSSRNEHFHFCITMINFAPSTLVQKEVPGQTVPLTSPPSPMVSQHPLNSGCHYSLPQAPPDSRSCRYEH